MLIISSLFLKPKLQKDYDQVTRAQREPIQIHGLKSKHLLSASQIEEAIILSNLYNLNELACVELLIDAETQMQYFPGLTRGLTAILLYYDNKKLLVNTLKTILLARNGRTWILDETIPNDVTRFINDFINKLIQDGLIKNLIGNLAYIYS